MNLSQWKTLKECAMMKMQGEVPISLIVDSPWIPGYTGISTMDYLTVPEKWFAANVKVINDFPDIIFLPGFWVEYGMAAEPSGFGCKISFYENATPQVNHIITSMDEIDRLKTPNPKKDGFMPFVLNLYKETKDRIEDIGHQTKIVASRGPFTIASHIMGLTDFLVGLKIDPPGTHKLLKMINNLIISWLEAQMDVLKEVEGIMLLDDVVGFLSREDYLRFAHPYLKEIFNSFPECIKIYHNDTDNPVPYEFLEELGVNIFNFTHMRSISEVRKTVGKNVCLMGNIAPLDVLAEGSDDMVRQKALECIKDNAGNRGFILSAGGGVSPGTPGKNIDILQNIKKEEN